MTDATVAQAELEQRGTGPGGLNSVDPSALPTGIPM